MRSLLQQNDVMDAVQRMRKKAQETGNLKSTELCRRWKTKVIENKSFIVVEQANPQVVYVPSYDPISVYGPPIYPYPPIYYPPAGYYAAGMAISFGVGLGYGSGLGAAVGAGGVIGAATTASTSTITIISIETRTLTAATATTSVMGTPAGSTIRSIAAALLIGDQC